MTYKKKELKQKTDLQNALTCTHVCAHTHTHTKY